MIKINETISLLCRLALATVFYLASLEKVWDPAAFAQATATYDILPIWAVNTFSAVLAWLELLLATMMIVGLWIRPAALWLAYLMAFFTALMIHAGLTGQSHNCGCFPGQDSAVGYADALRDFIIMLPALWLLWKPGTWLSLDTLAQKRMEKRIREGY